MLGDFDLISHSFDKGIRIAPVADVHLGAMECMETEWERFLQRVIKDDLYLILAGDLLNNSVKSAGFANPFEERHRPREAKKMMVEYLAPIRDRILCVTTGNHERRTLRDDDQDLTYDICAKLDIEHLYRENMAFMRVSVGQFNGGYKMKAANSYIFAVTHGTGGGIYTGASVNRNERFGNLIDGGLDCMVVGHVHKGFVTKPSKIVIDARNNRVSMKHYVVISCVSWLNFDGYAAQKMLLPAHVADPQILTLSDDHENKQIITTW